MKKILLNCVALTVMLFAGGVSAAQAQNIAKKVRKAKAIEVTYQSSYKGNVSPAKTLMTVNGNEVIVESARAAEALASGEPLKHPVTKTFINYADQKEYRWAILPDGKTIYAENPFTFGKNMTEVKKDKYLGLECTVMRTSINSNTIEIWFTTAIPFRGTPQPGVGVPD